MSTIARTPSPYLPTVIAALALASVFWLLLIAAGYGVNARVEFSQAEYQRQYYPVEYAERSKTPPLACALMLAVAGSAFASLALIVTSFCLWPRHTHVGKVLTVTSAVLFVPFLCCGVGLGVM